MDTQIIPTSEERFRILITQIRNCYEEIMALKLKFERMEETIKAFQEHLNQEEK